jgi:hypothetical protein
MLYNCLLAFGVWKQTVYHTHVRQLVCICVCFDAKNIFLSIYLYLYCIIISYTTRKMDKIFQIIFKEITYQFSFIRKNNI